MDALILVDLQNDFMPGGALAVQEGDQVVPLANRLMERFELTICTQDWHPADHGSFINQHEDVSIGDFVDLSGIRQVVWPVHCVQGTSGADFHSSLVQSGIDRVFQKGMDPKIDSYSGFFDNDHKSDTGLENYLRERGVDRVFVCGLATDYCVKFTALDAARIGFRTVLIEDACRGVNLKPGDVDAAIAEMNAASVEIIQSPALFR